MLMIFALCCLCELGKRKAILDCAKEQYQQARLLMLGDQIDIQQSKFDDLKKFVCTMYGKSYMNNVNDVRYASFQEHYVL